MRHVAHPPDRDSCLRGGSHDYCEKIKIANQELAKFRSSDEYDPEEIDDNKERMSQYNG